MLKFKEIKNSIIRTNREGQPHHYDPPRLSFKLTPRRSEQETMGRSPLSRRDSNRVEPFLYETSKKENTGKVDYFRSDGKQNAYCGYAQG